MSSCQEVATDHLPAHLRRQYPNGTTAPKTARKRELILAG
jgi:hypothetical protein